MEAAQAEMSHAAEFDHVIVNSDFAASVEAARAILHAARTRTARLVGLESFRRGLETD
jgi:guanylate kinase